MLLSSQPQAGGLHAPSKHCLRAPSAALMKSLAGGHLHNGCLAIRAVLTHQSSWPVWEDSENNPYWRENPNRSQQWTGGRHPPLPPKSALLWTSSIAMILSSSSHTAMLKIISQRITGSTRIGQCLRLPDVWLQRDTNHRKRKICYLSTTVAVSGQAPTLNRCLETSLSFTTGPLAPQPSWGASQTVGRQRGRHHDEQVWPLLCSTFASQSCTPPSLTEPSPRASLLFEKQEAISWFTSPDGVCDFPHAHRKSFRSSYWEASPPSGKTCLGNAPCSCFSFSNGGKIK